MTTGTAETVRGGRLRVRGALPRERGVYRARGVGDRVKGVLSDMSGQVSEEVFTRGIRLYNGGYVHETGVSWVYRVGSVNGGLYGYEVDLSVGSCTCKAYRLQGYVCKHVVAAGAAWVGKNA